jgi:signal transduction histidine kinase/iron only hydrogenase large subunit-like protein
METGIIGTIGNSCKRCYSCIRECPAQAIRVVNGQAMVMQERCIVCGHCITVCSQDAKFYQTDTELVCDELLPSKKSIAIVAPSFAASFPDNYSKFPTALRKLGFKEVVETAFGADLVSKLYVDVLQSDPGKTLISSACPAVVNYVEKYFANLVPNLVKIDSPMIALGKYLKANSEEKISVVFIGPCIAKKAEQSEDDFYGIIDGVLTFSDIKRMFRRKKINLNELEPSDFDPPHSYLGKSYPLPGGLLKTVDISSDILEKDIIVVEGKPKVMEIIHELAENKINAKFVDILFCEGCISGPAIDSELNFYSRREKVIKFIQERLNSIDKQVWKSNIYNSRNINLEREFYVKNQRRPIPSEEKIRAILAETNKFTKQDELNCGACGYETCRKYAIQIGKGLAEKEMCLPYLIDELKKINLDLRTAQDQLQSAEKLASIGQLAAGVAHEINNPLGTIILYSSMLKKEFERLSGQDQKSEDMGLIIEEANRCKKIVANLLNFARQGKLNIAKVDIYQLVNKIYKNISSGQLNGTLKFNVHINTGDTTVDGDADQLYQVFLNLINNAKEAMEESYTKRLDVSISREETSLVVEIKDTGSGIANENYNKLFTPFFTTKKIGKGTGLGLAITYGIVKMHKGDIKFQSELGKGTTFFVKLPHTQTTL